MQIKCYVLGINLKQINVLITIYVPSKIFAEWVQNVDYIGH